MIDWQHLVYAKHKSGFIFEIYFNLKAIASYSNSNLFFANFYERKIYSKNDQVVIITNNKMEILDFNLKACRLFKFYPKKF